ncbi:MAG: trigger factor [Bacteroidetes bacterium]|nr:MAG: trigger factor [Bacteroidota bacterium]
MPQVVRKDVDNLNAELTVTIEKKDYESKFVEELKKYRQQASMKGFRKGKTPMSVLKKMYGNSVLSNIVYDILNNELDTFLKEEKIAILGQPIPSEDTPEVSIDVKSMDDMVFKFDLGLAPDLEIKGFNKNKKFTRYVPTVSDEKVQGDIDNALKQLGDRETITEDIQETDSLKVSVKELDGKKVKEEGISSQFTVLVDKLTKKAKKQMLTKKAGDAFKVNIFDLEDGLEESQVKKYFLNIEDENAEVGKDFELTVDEVTRVTPMEFNEDFFNKYFGENVVADEKEATEKFKEPVLNHYKNHSEALLFRDFQDHLMGKNEMELPEVFLRRWLLMSNEELTEEQLDGEFDAFKENLKWDIIKGKIVKENDIQITSEEIVANAQGKIMGYFGGTPLPPDMMKDMTDRMLNDQNSLRQIQEEVISNKLYDVLETKFSYNEKEVTTDKMDDIIEKAREKAQK